MVVIFMKILHYLKLGGQTLWGNMRIRWYHKPLLLHITESWLKDYKDVSVRLSIGTHLSNWMHLLQ